MVEKFTLRFLVVDSCLLTCEVCSGERVLNFIPGVWGEGLGDLAQKVASFIRYPGVDEVAWTCMDEPAQHKLVIHRHGKAVQIKIYEDRGSCGPRHPKRQELLFVAETTLVRLGTQIMSELYRLLHEHGAEEYRKVCGCSFPHGELAFLATMLAEYRQGEKK